LVLVWGDDEFAVGRRSRQIFESWTLAHPAGDREILEGGASTVDEALRVLARLREALQTLPFFGGPKLIWLRQCSFLGEDRVSESKATLEATADWARELAAFRWDDVRLLISASRVDRRRTFYKTLEKCASVEAFTALSPDDRDWREKALQLASGEFRELGRKPSPDALDRFLEFVGPYPRQLASEARKLADYAGDRTTLTVADVEAVVTRGRQARAFALAEAVGDRDLPRALRRLDEELWSLQSDRQKSEIGLLYGLISKVRALLLTGELFREGLLRPTTDYRAFAAQLKELPANRLPTDKRYNPRDINAYILFRAAQQTRRFTTDELVNALHELLNCNRRLVSSQLEGHLILPLALTRILSRPGHAPLARPQLHA
jgi:DNA polymerase-3 subunit delta